LNFISLHGPLFAVTYSSTYMQICFCYDHVGLSLFSWHPLSNSSSSRYTLSDPETVTLVYVYGAYLRSHEAT